jgi:hypothetical protein
LTTYQKLPNDVLLFLRDIGLIVPRMARSRLVSRYRRTALNISMRSSVASLQCGEYEV